MTGQFLLPASALMGNDVKNAQGDNLGHVKDIVLDTESNRVTYYVLSFGGIFSMGDKFFAIPPEAMQLNVNDKCFILNVDKERLSKAEGFNKGQWPNMADPKFRSNLYQHYGIDDNLAA